MANVMFDTNIFNRILDGEIDIDELKSKENKYYSTHIQWDELNKCPDKKERRTY